MKNNFIKNQKSRHVDAIKESQTNAPIDAMEKFPASAHNGLAELQRDTVSLMNQRNRNWGFTNSQFEVRRQKLNDNLWKITVENPKTHQIILEAEGSSDKMFAYEDSLARMAEVLTAKGLKITTQI